MRLTPSYSSLTWSKVSGRECSLAIGHHFYFFAEDIVLNFSFLFLAMQMSNPMRFQNLTQTLDFHYQALANGVAQHAEQRRAAIEKEKVEKASATPASWLEARCPRFAEKCSLVSSFLWFDLSFVGNGEFLRIPMKWLFQLDGSRSLRSVRVLPRGSSFEALTPPKVVENSAAAAFLSVCVWEYSVGWVLPSHNKSGSSQQCWRNCCVIKWDRQSLSLARHGNYSPGVSGRVRLVLLYTGDGLVASIVIFWVLS